MPPLGYPVFYTVDPPPTTPTTTTTTTTTAEFILTTIMANASTHASKFDHFGIFHDNKFSYSQPFNKLDFNKTLFLPN